MEDLIPNLSLLTIGIIIVGDYIYNFYKSTNKSNDNVDIELLNQFIDKYLNYLKDDNNNTIKILIIENMHKLEKGINYNNLISKYVISDNHNISEFYYKNTDLNNKTISIIDNINNIKNDEFINYFSNLYINIDGIAKKHNIDLNKVKKIDEIIEYISDKNAQIIYFKEKDIGFLLY